MLGAAVMQLALPLLLSAAIATTAGKVDPLQLFKPAAPVPPEGCRESLKSGGVRFSPWPLRPSRIGERRRCARRRKASPSSAAAAGCASSRWRASTARSRCASARFEAVMQEEARSIFKSPVASIVHLGTYNCRKMAAYPDFVSEHSFANAIDIATFVLKNGRRVEVERDWVRAEQPATTPAARFLRRLTRRLYDEQISASS